MTLGGPNDRLSKNQRREAAREKAKVLREQQKRRDRRNRVLLQGGVIVGLVAILAVVALILVPNITRQAGPGPANMASDGIVIGEGLVARTTDPIAADGTPTPTASDSTSGAVDIRVYLDYLCPYCGQFETTNGDQIKEWVNSGAATVEIHPLAILTSRSNGTKYSERAANAAACVANTSPDSFFDFNALLFANQPEEGTDGLTNDELKGFVETSGAADTATIDSCIDSKSYVSWVQDATERATSGPLPGTQLANVSGTPTVLVNGQSYTGSLTDPEAFSAFVLQAAGATYSSATPTPTPSAG